MKTAIKRVLPFLLSFVILCVFAVQCFRAPSVGAASTNKISSSGMGVTPYQSATLTYANKYGLLMVSFIEDTTINGAHSVSFEVNDIAMHFEHFKQTLIDPDTGYETSLYIYYRYVANITKFEYEIYSKAACSGSVALIDNVKYPYLVHVESNDSPLTYSYTYEPELDYMTYIWCTNNVKPVSACTSHTSMQTGVLRYAYTFRNITLPVNATWTLTDTVTKNGFMILALSEEKLGLDVGNEEDGVDDENPDSSNGSSGDSSGGVSSGEQLEVSNNILTNIKNILQYIADLPSNIFNAFSERITAIINAIQTLPQLIADNIESILTRLFIPADGFIQHCIDSIMDAIYERFPFIDTLFTLWKNVNTRLSSADSSAPVFSITYDGTEIVFMDFSIFEPYIADVRAIILAIVWIVFSIHMMKKVPGIIQGSPDPAVIRTNLDEVEL